MESVGLNLTLSDIDGEYVFKIADTVLLTLNKNDISGDAIDNLYEGMVKAFGLGLHFGQESVKSGSTGFSVK